MIIFSYQLFTGCKLPGSLFVNLRADLRAPWVDHPGRLGAGFPAASISVFPELTYSRIFSTVEHTGSNPL